MYIWKDLTSWIINFPTKDDWKDPSKYEYIESGLIDLAEYLRGYGSVTVALPALGCGNGGLDWDIVSKMIQKYLGELEANILVYTPRDSYSAGKTVQEVSLAQGESLMLELGFYKKHLKNISDDLWASGNMNILHRAWVLFSSPDETTEKPLTSIISASSLLQREQITPVFIYNNEKIISYLHKLNDEHIPVVVIFPFFIPKRSNLISKLRELKNNLYISIIKTEIQYGVAYAKTINFALSKAIGYIYSGFTIDGLLKNKSTLNDISIDKYFIYYNEMNNDDITFLYNHNFKEIKKNKKTNTPNISGIIQRYESIKNLADVSKNVKLPLTPDKLHALAEYFRKNNIQNVDIFFSDEQYNAYIKNFIHSNEEI